MNILYANKFFFLNGGSERVFFQEREFLQANGHAVVDFSMEDERNVFSEYSSYFIANVDFNTAKGLFAKLNSAANFIHSPVAVTNLQKLLQQEKPQIAHLHNIYHQLTPSIIPVLKKSGAKVVLTLHDFKLICPSYLALRGDEICLDCDGRRFWKPFTTNCQQSRFKGLLLSLEAIFHQIKKSYDQVDCFLAPSQFMADVIAKRIDREKIRVLKNGIDTDAFVPQYEDTGYGLYFGRLSKEKGVETLLNAYEKSSHNFPLKIVGTGPLEDDLKEDYAEAEFLGYKSGDELQQLIKNAAFVVVPSEWYENCSMVVLEAMAYGKPVIGSRIGGIPEQIEDGVTGLLFEMGNARELAEKMEYLIDNPEVRTEMGKAARAKLEREYSLQQHCESLVSMYEQLLK